MSQTTVSQVDTLARITADIGVSLNQPPPPAADVFDSPRATLSQLVRDATAESPLVVAAPQDDDRPSQVDRVPHERAALLVECDALVQDRRKLMLERCSEWQRLIEQERLECLQDIVELQRARDERLANMSVEPPSTP